MRCQRAAAVDSRGGSDEAETRIAPARVKLARGLHAALSRMAVS